MPLYLGKVKTQGTPLHARWTNFQFPLIKLERHWRGATHLISNASNESADSMDRSDPSRAVLVASARGCGICRPARDSLCNRHRQRLAHGTRPVLFAGADREHVGRSAVADEIWASADASS